MTGETSWLLVIDQNPKRLESNTLSYAIEHYGKSSLQAQAKITLLTSQEFFSAFGKTWNVFTAKLIIIS